jgi:hypothetical protein
MEKGPTELADPGPMSVRPDLLLRDNETTLNRALETLWNLQQEHKA